MWLLVGTGLDIDAEVGGLGAMRALSHLKSGALAENPERDVRDRLTFPAISIART
jgi:hypothetical protein